ncbi:hypothetical protein [Pontibacillus sp. HMF3514]|uniref:hypothetical protein n=1 Tax=Pontibacillus sp. HMF3514 TaxID=2692425 RepID=UPI00131F89AB|nr:hypothetical protein [Pontibacillus sp. HMF3514]QHE52765.1 hypothetical protein GS400_12325 [Pontibacillus sp. HMF3514]
MKILIGQPKREQDLKQLETEIENSPSVDLILYPESYFKESYLEKACELAEKYNTAIITGYKDNYDLDRVLVINSDGKVILERAKTPEEGELYTPSTVEDKGMTYGYLLCREVFQGLEGLKDENSIDLIFNPIGVGMFSEEQFSDWSGEAKKIAVQQKTLVLGASHADGSYKNCGFSIPIAYCFDENGETIMLSKDDTRTRIIDTVTKTVEIKEHPAIKK